MRVKNIEKLLNLFRSAWEWIVFRSIKKLIKELLLDTRSIWKIIKEIELKFPKKKVEVQKNIKKIK